MTCGSVAGSEQSPLSSSQQRADWNSLTIRSIKLFKSNDVPLFIQKTMKLVCAGVEGEACDKLVVLVTKTNGKFKIKLS